MWIQKPHYILNLMTFSFAVSPPSLFRCFAGCSADGRRCGGSVSQRDSSSQSRALHPERTKQTPGLGKRDKENMKIQAMKQNRI